MHIPVLLHEVIDSLRIGEGEFFIDGTVNRGGHAKEIADRLGRTGWLLGIDQDGEALKAAEANLAAALCRTSLIKGNFRNIAAVAHQEGMKQANGILLDIGFSSDQIENSGRGFSFLKDEPLNMSFDTEASEERFNAADIVNDWDEANLADVIYGYGEEAFARRIAKRIVEARERGRIERTADLVEIIRQAVPHWYAKKRIHFATKTFQALRIAVNDELGALKDGLAGSWDILAPGGRLAVISFHSLEARIIKEFMRSKEKSEEGEMAVRKAVTASREEILSNPRSRSAQLRTIQKF